MAIHIEPIVCTIRWYDDPDGFSKKLPYKAVATINILGTDTVFISGMQGEINSAMLKELAIWAKEHNIQHVFASRRGKWKKYNVDSYL